MQSSSFAQIQHFETGQPTECAPVEKQTEAERAKQEMLRYTVASVALLAVLLLMTIAFYYSNGSSDTVKHVSALQPFLSARAGV